MQNTGPVKTKKSENKRFCGSDCLSSFLYKLWYFDNQCLRSHISLHGADRNCACCFLLQIHQEQHSSGVMELFYFVYTSTTL